MAALYTYNVLYFSFYRKDFFSLIVLSVMLNWSAVFTKWGAYIVFVYEEGLYSTVPPTGATNLRSSMYTLYAHTHQGKNTHLSTADTGLNQ